MPSDAGALRPVPARMPMEQLVLAEGRETVLVEATLLVVHSNDSKFETAARG